MKLSLLAHPYDDKLAGVRLRVHLMEQHGWSVAMVLSRRFDEDYLQSAHQKAHGTKP
jgi:hypothetical protein